MNRVSSRMSLSSIVFHVSSEAGSTSETLANDIDIAFLPSFPSSFLSHPKRFECDIKPRLPKYAELIEAAAAVHH